MLQYCVSPDPRKVQVLMNILPSKSIKELQSFVSILNYLSKFSPATAEVYKPLQKVMLVKAEWSWNGIYQNLYDKAKKIIKQDASKPWYLEIDVFNVSLGAESLQVREGMNCGHDKVPDNVILCPIAFASKSLSSAEWWHNNIEWGELGILHGLKRFHHYCFAKEIYKIMDHKPLVVMVNKDVATVPIGCNISCCTSINTACTFYTSLAVNYIQVGPA